MSKLAPLRSRLSTLRRQRALVRWGNAYSALLIAILWTLLAAFVIDFGFELGRAERVVLWLAGIAIGLAVYQKFTRPHLGKSES
ncbi:MAG TPA: hypothetical protein VHB77_11545, partial [Planctomycetaceae bacterium]|nr:hypothetical protein [Planctomycetaceae bacterium]